MNSISKRLEDTFNKLKNTQITSTTDSETLEEYLDLLNYPCVSEKERIAAEFCRFLSQSTDKFITFLIDSNLEQLILLADYRTICDYFKLDPTMIFWDMKIRKFVPARRTPVKRNPKYNDDKKKRTDARRNLPNFRLFGGKSADESRNERRERREEKLSNKNNRSNNRFNKNENNENKNSNGSTDGNNCNDCEGHCDECNAGNTSTESKKENNWADINE